MERLVGDLGDTRGSPNSLADWIPAGFGSLETEQSLNGTPSSTTSLTISALTTSTADNSEIVAATLLIVGNGTTVNFS
jgi:hypothetical protein